MPLHSSLGNKSKTPSQKRKRKKKKEERRKKKKKKGRRRRKKVVKVLSEEVSTYSLTWVQIMDTFP